MKLEIESKGTSNPVNAAEIQTALQGLQGFAILGPDEMNYMQASGSPEESYTLEYQTGDTDQHYSSKAPVSEATMIQAFVHYFQKNPEWKSLAEWEKMDF